MRGFVRHIGVDADVENYSFIYAYAYAYTYTHADTTARRWWHLCNS